MSTHLSDLALGFGAKLETGKWIIWSGDGTWRGVTPPMDEWREAGDVTALRSGCSLKWCPLDNHIRYVDAPWDDDIVTLTRAEQAYLYEILERVYLKPQRLVYERAEAKREEEAKATRAARIREIEAAGRATRGIRHD